MEVFASFPPPVLLASAEAKAGYEGANVLRHAAYPKKEVCPISKVLLTLHYTGVGTGGPGGHSPLKFGQGAMPPPLKKKASLEWNIL